MTRRAEGSYFSIGRVEAYTDAVFAIAATLLVLDLTTTAIGEVDSDRELWAALGGMADSFVAFLVSFLLLSLLWMVHFQQFRDLERADGMLLWINNIRLLFIVLIPFTTSLVADYSAFVGGRVLLPVNFFFAALLGYLSWAWAASRGGHLLKDASKPSARENSMAAVGAVICGAVAVVLSPWIGSWAFLVYVFNRPLTTLLQRRAARRN